MERTTSIALAAGLIAAALWGGLDAWRLGRLTSQLDGIEAELAPHSDVVAELHELDTIVAEIERRTAVENQLDARRYDYSTIATVAREINRSARLVAVTASGPDLELVVDRVSDHDAATLGVTAEALWLGGNGSVTVRSQSSSPTSQP